MKKFLLVLLIALPLFFLKDVHGANLVSTCTWKNSNELDMFYKNNLDFLNLKYNKKYKYIAYCMRSDYDVNKIDVTQPFSHGCLFNFEGDVGSANSIDCSIYFEVNKLSDGHLQISYASGSRGFTFTPKSFEIVYKQLDIENKSHVVMYSILGIMIVFIFLFSILKMVGV